MGSNHNTKEFRIMRSVCIWLHNHLCFNCKRIHFDLEVHHVNGISSDNKLTNLVPLCKSCHKLYHKTDIKAVEQRKNIVVLLLKKVALYSFK